MCMSELYDELKNRLTWRGKTKKHKLSVRHYTINFSSISFIHIHSPHTIKNKLYYGPISILIKLDYFPGTIYFVLNEMLRVGQYVL